MLTYVCVHATYAASAFLVLGPDICACAFRLPCSRWSILSGMQNSRTCKKILQTPF